MTRIVPDNPLRLARRMSVCRSDPGSANTHRLDDASCSLLLNSNAGFGQALHEARQCFGVAGKVHNSSRADAVTNTVVGSLGLACLRALRHSMIGQQCATTGRSAWLEVVALNDCFYPHCTQCRDGKARAVLRAVFWMTCWCLRPLGGK